MAEPILVEVPIKLQVLRPTEMHLKMANIEVEGDDFTADIYNVIGGTVEVGIKLENEAFDHRLRVTISPRDLLNAILDHEDDLRAAFDWEPT